MVTWYCYPTGDKPDLWEHWFGCQSRKVQAKHAVAMRFLSDGYWKRPHYRDLAGQHQGLGEIKVSAEVEWRLIGRRDKKQDSFTVLVICFHKDKNYTPRDALDTALRRWGEIENKTFERIKRNDPPA